MINFILTLTSMLSAVLIGWLNSIALRHFHAVILNISLGPIDTIFLVVGLLAIGSGINAMVRLRGGVRVAQEGEQIGSHQP
ncbi:hypothetical protein [Ktedonobacter racemifer]|uniref:Major facilitator superfamily MFS_1 n=1 Tax=Ktedonobacter racemifer DSM 44963 TaxID=485913 RepID=D6TUX0_KTERA|nr:hypothetical protein [Ktedonobacter racemifer]EFH85296.1 major facilitator superfamily MFS_1 [Ktedonobacter racemifer DSM 44963]